MVDSVNRICGFESGLTPTASTGPAEMVLAGTASNGTVALDSLVPRSGRYCLKIAATGASPGGLGVHGWPHLASGTPNLYSTFHIRIDTLPATNPIVIYEILIASGPNNMTRVLLNPNGTLQLQRADPSNGVYGAYLDVGSPSAALSLNTWHRIDVSSLNSNSAGNFSTELKLNGVSVASGSGFSLFATCLIFTAEIGSKNGTHINDDTGYIFYLDDIAYSDTAFISTGGVINVPPGGNGNYTGWTGDWSDVDEIPPTATAILTTTSNTAAETPSLVSSANAGVSGSIACVQPWMFAARGATSGVTISTRLRSGTTDVDNTDLNAGTLSNGVYKLYGDVYIDTDPNTGVAWTQSGLDAAQVGAVATGGTSGDRNIAGLGLFVWCSDPQPLAPLSFPPTITSISPNSGPKAGGTAVTITGENFQQAGGVTSVTIGGIAITGLSVDSDTSITGTTAAASKAGNYPVQATNGDGTATLLSGFTYTPGNSGANSGNNAGGASTLVISMPTTTVGDMLIAVITLRGTGSTATQANWTQIDSRSDGVNSVTKTFKRISTGGSEPGSYTWTTSNVKASGVITATPDVDTKASDQVSSQANGSSTNISAPDMTPRRLGAVSIYGAGTAVGTTVTPPGGYTEPANADSASTGQGASTRTTSEQAYKQLTDLTATGTVIGVGGAAATNVGVQVLLDPPTTISPIGISSAQALGSPTLVQGAPPSSNPTILPSAIASSAAVGSPTLLKGNVNIQPSAIASAEQFGSVVVKARNSILPNAINGSEAFGTPTVKPGGVIIAPSAIASGEAFGSPTLQSILNLIILLTSIDSGESVGTPTLTAGGVVISPSAISSGESVGSPSLVATASILPSGIGSAEALGTPSILPGSIKILPGAIASAEAVGVPTLIPVARILPSAISSDEQLGTPTLTTQNLGVTIQPSSIDTSEAFGAPTLLPGVVTIQPAALASAEAVSSPTVLPGSVKIQPTAIVSAETLGTPVLAAGTARIQPSSIASQESIGTHRLVPVASILPAAISSQEAFGADTLRPGGVIISVGAIASAETFGSAIIAQAGGPRIIQSAAIDSAEVVGTPSLRTSGSIISPTAITSSESFGSQRLLAGQIGISPTSIGSGEALGTPDVLPGNATVVPSGVPSAESLGTPDLFATSSIRPSAITSSELFGLPVLVPNTTIVVEGVASEEALGFPQLGIPLFILPTAIDSEEVIGRVIIQGARIRWKWTRQSGFAGTRKGGWPASQKVMVSAKKHKGET